MAVVEDIARLILEADTKGFTDAKAQITKLEAEMTTLSTQYKSGAIGIDEYVASGRRLRDQIDQLRAAYAAAESAAQKYGSASAAATEMAKQAQAASQNYGRGLMQLAFTVQDFTSANGDLAQSLYRIQNNIPGLLAGLGASQGVAGAISLITLALAPAIPKIQEYAEKLGIFGEKGKEARDQIERLQDRIEKLQKKPFKLAVDDSEIKSAQQRIKELQSAQQAFEAFRSNRDPNQKLAGQQAEELIAMTPGGGKQLADKLAAEVAKEQLKTDTNYLELLSKHANQTKLAKEREETGKRLEAAGARQQANSAYAESNAADVEARRLKEELGKAEENIKGNPNLGITGSSQSYIGDLYKKVTAGNDPNARAEFVKRLRGIGEHGLAGQLESTTPDTADQALEEERQEKAEENANETKAFIDDLNRERQKKATRAEQDKIRAALDVMTKGGDLTSGAATALAKIQKDNGAFYKGVQRDAKTPEAQFELLKEIVNDELSKKLADKGLDLTGEGSAKIVEQGAGTVAGAGQSKLKQDQADAKAKAERHEHVRHEIDRKGAARALQQEEEEIANQGLKERAEEVYAQITQQVQVNGGGMINNGRFQRWGPEQIRIATQDVMQQWMKRKVGEDEWGNQYFANPNMGARQTQDVATKLSLDAEKQFNQRAGQLQGAGLNATEATQVIVGELQQVVDALSQKLQQVEQNNKLLQGNMAHLWRGANAPTPTNLPGGQQ